MSFVEAIHQGIEIVKLNRGAYRRVAADPEAFSPALMITAIVGIAIWLPPRADSIFGIITLPLLQVVFLFVASAILHFVATLFGGRGDYMVFLRVFGVSRVLGWARVVPVIGVVIDMWSVVIAAVAVEELYGLERTKAILVVVVPASILILLGLMTAFFHAAFLGGWSAGSKLF